MNRLSNSGLTRISRIGQLCLLTVAMFAVSLSSAHAQTAPAVIGVINLDQVVANAPAGKALGKKLEEFQQQAQRELEVFQGKAADIRKQLTEGAGTLTQDQVGELQKAFEDQQIAVRRLQGDKTREAQKIQNEGLAEIEKQLRPVIESVRTEGGYDLILNNQPGVVVLVGPRIDITKAVIDKLNGS